MKIATVTTLKASLDDTISFIHYHLNIGVDHVFLFFDNPDDKAIPLFSNYTNVTCTSCTEQHWNSIGCTSKSNIETRQTLNADLALQWCRKKSFDWIAHIDSDELLYTKDNSLKKILLSLDQEISYLSMPPLEAIPSTMDCSNPFLELKHFKVLIKDKDELQALPNKDTILYKGEYFRSHLGGKSFTRISENITSLQIHKPSSESCVLLPNNHKEAFLLHFDCYDYQNWITKWSRRKDGTALFSGGRDNRNKQFTDFINALDRDKENTKLKSLYKNMYMIPTETLLQLKEKKAVVTIDLNPDLFKLSI